MRKLNEKIEKILNEIVEKLKDNFKEGLCGVLLYGSWATGKARETSDIDLLVVFEEVTGRIRKSAYEVIGDVKSEMKVSIVLTSREEFQKEKIPLFTAVKKEGILLYGDLDLRLNPSPPEEKYKEFFRKSQEFEKRKVENAEKKIRLESSPALIARSVSLEDFEPVKYGSIRSQLQESLLIGGKELPKIGTGTGLDAEYPDDYGDYVDYCLLYTSPSPRDRG